MGIWDCGMRIGGGLTADERGWEMGRNDKGQNPNDKGMTNFLIQMGKFGVCGGRLEI
jgi:hypothetical protein